MPNKQLRIYISVTFWGQEHRQNFLDFSLASLMAPGNIPSISYKETARLLIATRDEDWAALQTEPMFLAAQRLITIEHIPHNLIADYPTKYLAASAGHKSLAQRMFSDRAHGIFVYPDMIIPPNTISRIESLARDGVEAALCMQVRLSNEGLIAELKGRGLIKRGQPLAIETDELVRLSIKHMHSETARCGFESSSFDFGCCSYFWVVSPGEELLFHSGNWAPILIDYGAIKNHDISTFDSWTIDGDYVAKNMLDLKNIYFIRDSDDLFMSSFTPESEVHYPLKTYFPYRFPRLRKYLKTFVGHQFLFRQGILKRLGKEDAFDLPVRLRGGNSSEKQWADVEAQAAMAIQKMHENFHSVSGAVIYFCLTCGFIASKFLSFVLNLVPHARDFVRSRFGRWVWRPFGGDLNGGL